MGLPVKHLIVATNSNDILHRFSPRVSTTSCQCKQLAHRQWISVSVATLSGTYSIYLAVMKASWLPRCRSLTRQASYTFVILPWQKLETTFSQLVLARRISKTLCR